MNTQSEFKFVSLTCVAPFQYEFVIQGSTITLLHQFESEADAFNTARHYESLLQKAQDLGYSMNGYYFLGPNGQTLPISRVFDLDMSIHNVEYLLSSGL